MQKKTSKINIKDVQKLRDETGAGVMEAKRALTENEGDFEKAIDWIKEKGLVKIEKRAGRETGAGLLESYIHNERIGVLLEIKAETDFVVRSDPFQKLAHEVVMQIAAMAPEDIDSLLKQPYIKDETQTIKDLINRVIGQVGENINVTRFCRFEL